jgi:hypothetical protein
MKLKKAQQNGINEWLFILKTVNQLEKNKKRILGTFNDLQKDEYQTIYEKINMAINIELYVNVEDKFTDDEKKLYKKCYSFIWAIATTKLFSDILTYDNVKQYNKQINK